MLPAVLMKPRTDKYNPPPNVHFRSAQLFYRTNLKTTPLSLDLSKSAVFPNSNHSRKRFDHNYNQSASDFSPAKTSETHPPNPPNPRFSHHSTWATPTPKSQAPQKQPVPQPVSPLPPIFPSPIPHLARQLFLTWSQLTSSPRSTEWTEQVRHKYCGALDIGRKGKPNKVHRCEACLAIKARQSRGSGGEKAIKEGRQEKMSWHLGGGGS
ncbi:hypothetical protein B0J18DRAFT_421640 [Chaetomium sp. MPI-SDFR-AT-0129]|nr:hypothetical protein B0J18DRAFT_421640 [Chaetomium sp. MPI-SDFR-AT-0129]